ncbi:MAG: hypothetical protein WD875_13355 [Pirellulales bacterium]
MKRAWKIIVAAALTAVLALPVEDAFAGGKGGKSGSSGRSGSSSRSSSGKSSGGNSHSGGFASRAKSSGFGGISKNVVKSPINKGTFDKIKKSPVGNVDKHAPVFDNVKKPPFGNVVKHPLPFPGPICKPICPPPHCPPPYCPPHYDHGHHHGFCFTLPLYPCYPTVTEEVLVVEQVIVPVPVAGQDAAAPQDPAAAQAAAAAEAAKQAAADEAAKALDNAQAADKLPMVPAGATLTLQGQNLGEKQGQVALQIGQLSIPATMVKWDGKSTTVTLPNVGLTEATPAQIHVFTAEAKLVSSLAVQLVPAASVEAAAAEASGDATTDAATQAGESTVGQAQVANN